LENKAKYDQIFINCFGVEENALTDELVYNSVKTWDSVGHMEMIATLEEVFDIMMETDDIIDFSSYLRGIQILKEHYDVEF
jgi:acyl carrier protein